MTLRYFCLRTTAPRQLSRDPPGKDWHSASSKQVLQPIPEAPFAMSSVGMDVVDQRVDEQHEVDRLELEAVKPAAQMSLPVDHVGHHAMHLGTVRSLREL